MRDFDKKRLVLFFGLCLLLFMVTPAFAQLPWEGPISILGNSLTTAGFWIGVIGFIVAGAIMVFGNDMSDLGRRAVLATMAVSVILLAQDFVGALFNV